MRKKKTLQPIVLATNNRHKVKEIKAILRKAGVKNKILTLGDFPRMKPVVENKPTIEGNAVKKASEVAKTLGYPALSDDTGLFIDALRGRPGVYSARFAGPNCSFKDNNAKVLRLMKKFPISRRRAVFRTVAALATPNGKKGFVEGRIVGRIVTELKSGIGFGYDPIFFVPSLKKTFSQMASSQKNSVSHRARAFRKTPGLIRRMLK